MGTSALFGKMGDVNVSLKKNMVKVCLEVMAEFIIEDCKSKFLHIFTCSRQSNSVSLERFMFHSFFQGEQLRLGQNPIFLPPFGHQYVAQNRSNLESL